MNVMNHQIANLIGVNQEGVSDKLRSLVPGYMAMGSDGMHEMSEMNMGGPKNTLPMMTGTGPVAFAGVTRTRWMLTAICGSVELST